MSTKKSYGQIQRERLHAALDSFLDEVVKNHPRMDDGESMEFELSVGISSASEDDDVFFDVALSTKRNRVGI